MQSKGYDNTCRPTHRTVRSLLSLGFSSAVYRKFVDAGIFTVNDFMIFTGEQTEEKLKSIGFKDNEIEEAISKLRLVGAV
jgi:hypothetical protein